jgi:DNA repair protein SbcD/Mre11
MRRPNHDQETSTSPARPPRRACRDLSAPRPNLANVRILHTSDWHLGRQFHRVDMLVHQEAFIDHLVDVVRTESVDAVVVAGDVYDRALPSVDTVALLDEAIARLRDAGAVVLLTSGNHDSAVRLGFGSRVLEQGGVHVRARLADLARPVVLEGEHGPVLLYGVPYLEPAMAADDLACERRSHAAVLTAAMDRVRADLAQRPAGSRSVVAAHAFVVGGEASDSERDISVGGVSSVPADVFAGVDYVALGHLHGRQQVGEAVRYSGSPLPYSFSEHRHTKGSWLVHVDGAGVRDVEPVLAPVARPLAVLRGRLDDLLRGAEHVDAERAWCQVTLTDPVRPREAMARVRQRFPHALVLAFEPDVGADRDDGYAARVRGQSALDVCCGFLEHVRGGAGADGVERDMLSAALEGARADAARAESAA